MKIILTSLCVAFLSFISGDVHKEMYIKDEVNIKEYCLVFFSPMGGTSFTGTTNKQLIFFEGDYNEEELDLKCTKKTQGELLIVDFEMMEKSEGFSDVFDSADEEHTNNWDIFLRKNKPSKLDFSFGYGEVNINLSGLSVKTLHIEDLKSSIRLNYSIGQPNRVRMDTMKISSELGDILFDGPELSHARHISIDNSYGNTTLNIKGRPVDRFVANVYLGTGKVFVNLPYKNIPVKVVMKEKHLASLKLPEDFDQLSDRIFVNEAYERSKIDPLVFNLHGSLGEAVFQIKR